MFVNVNARCEVVVVHTEDNPKVSTGSAVTGLQRWGARGQSLEAKQFKLLRAALMNLPLESLE